MRVLLVLAGLLVLPTLGEAQCRLEPGGYGLAIAIDVRGEPPIEARLNGSVALEVSPGRAMDGFRVRALGPLHFNGVLTSHEGIWVAGSGRDFGEAGRGPWGSIMHVSHVDERGELWAHGRRASVVGPFDCSGLRLLDVPDAAQVQRLGYLGALTTLGLYTMVSCLRSATHTRRVRGRAHPGVARVRSSPGGAVWGYLQTGAEVRGLELRCGWVQLSRLAGVINCEVMERAWVWLGAVGPA